MKKACTLLMALVMTLLLAACGGQNADSTGDADNPEDTNISAENEPESPSNESPATRIITDRRDRQVQIPEKVETIVCLGSGAPRIAAYLQVTDMMVGAEDCDTGDVTVRRDYSWVCHDALKDLPSVGSGGGSGENNAYAEQIIELQPDVILAGYTAESADELQKTTGIPVVSVSYSSINFVDQSFYDATRIFAEVVGAEERCEELLTFIDECKADLTARTSSYADSDKPSCYTGAVTFSGRHGFCGTYANFGPFLAVNALNVADEVQDVNYFETDFEQVLVWDPDIIFLDPGNMDMVNEEYAANPDYFASVRAVREERVYTMPSFNNASTNITYCLMDGYWTGMVLYPDAFADTTMEAVSERILTFMLGTNYYEDMMEQGLYYGKITMGE
ncbi:MAG: iron ABC transporter substrate-binding protein [Oscillospiraceae bacterium]|nr:iron ABC transporter substrate-binding protein [Oscillospiraceae bacterium]